MIEEFLQFQVLLRLYHWKTSSYPRHMASGSLYEKLDTLIDKFIETAQSKRRMRYNTFRITCRPLDDSGASKLLEKFADFLRGLLIRSPDLLNIRDEMLAEVEQTQYLFSLR